jgi:hypothetical protein
MRALFVLALVSPLALPTGITVGVSDYAVAHAQVGPSVAPAPETREPVNVQPPRGMGGPHQRPALMSRLEFGLSVLVILFGLIVIFIEFWLLRRSALRPDEILRIFALTLIIIGPLFFVTAGFDSNQIAPAMGLFGTIAGYLLGRRSRADDQASRVQNAPRE